ncbi:hypothetical protein SCP_0600260 [Sparassis crispa]|uniref:Uncharacterized protein n=1 Tax=Sparassis crispa TaxID=139825 RepID=A0A401GPH0_9APHY|nr:hypothetical protein SCP_0600260 [Sparassis crispa]GBE84049.1 hypothetical protein SCP_0600260 [Sparassis crispa]
MRRYSDRLQPIRTRSSSVGTTNNSRTEYRPSMADVTYNTSFPSLIRTLSALTGVHCEQPVECSCETGVATQSKSPLILLEYNERDAAERTLWNMMCEVGIKFEQVGEKVGSGGEPAEIWVGSVLP